MYNQNLTMVQIAGRLIGDPTMKELSEGKLVMNFTIAYNGRRKTDASGSFTSFIQVELWEKLAEFYADKLKKGMQILVKGELMQSRWKDKSGANRSTMRVSAHGLAITDLKNRPEEMPKSA